MRWKMIHLYFFFLVGAFLQSCQSPQGHTEQESVDTKQERMVDELNACVDSNRTIGSCLAPPTSYVRQSVEDGSFAKYLRNLPLKEANADVKYYNGESKNRGSVYCRVVDLGIGNKDLHQCADAVMRLRAEYLWEEKAYDKIHFNFTNGFRVDYSEWMKGKRIAIHENRTSWREGGVPSNSYEDFWKYLEVVFMYAGTASLEKELESININDADIGDVLIQGGYPGHAVIIVDKAVHQQSGKPIYLLAQSYMPAQEIQILVNPLDDSLSPWYSFDDDEIMTPEWRFVSSDIMRFP